MPSRIGILRGTGRMGRGLARGYTKAGHRVFLGSRTPKRAQHAATQVEGDPRGGSLDAAQESEIIVVAVPFRDAASTVGALSAALAGKVVVDITNPFGAVPPGQISGIEFNARAASSARWVAAYKTTFWKTLEEPQLADGTKRDVLVRSDDRQAKQTVITLIEELNALATRPEFVHPHQWQPHELIVWDNRCVLHRATSFDTARARRVMRRATVLGDIPH